MSLVPHYSYFRLIKRMTTLIQEMPENTPILVPSRVKAAKKGNDPNRTPNQNRIFVPIQNKCSILEQNVP